MNVVRGLLIGVVALALVSTAFAVAAVRADEGTTSWVAVLAGENEVPARDTNARGVANFENVIASHIHLAPAGVNGAVVIFLFGNVAPGGGRVQGPIAEGDLTAA